MPAITLGEAYVLMGHYWAFAYVCVKRKPSSSYTLEVISALYGTVMRFSMAKITARVTVRDNQTIHFEIPRLFSSERQASQINQALSALSSLLDAGVHIARTVRQLRRQQC